MAAVAGALLRAVQVEEEEEAAVAEVALSELPQQGHQVWQEELLSAERQVLLGLTHCLEEEEEALILVEAHFTAVVEVVQTAEEAFLSLVAVEVQEYQHLGHLAQGESRDMEETVATE
jgi:hypothetical protein